MASAEQAGVEVPQTLEGWYVLHDVYRVKWPAWRALPAERRAALAREAAEWTSATARGAEGDTAAYSVVSQKGDLLWIHYRRTPEEINAVELALRQLGVYEYLEPAYSYFSVIEASLYEVTAIAMKRLADRGLRPGTPEFDAARDEEMTRQKQHMNERLYRKIPPQRYVCFYPMNKRRGEARNWYAEPVEERARMMLEHGKIGRHYAGAVTQLISGAIGFDDWEWGVDLFADDPVVFKKLIYEMRFDEASAWYAEFGPFYVGLQFSPSELPGYLEGEVPALRAGP